MRHSYDNGVVALSVRRVLHLEPIFLLGFSLTNPRVVDVDVDAIALKLLDNINHARIA